MDNFAISCPPCFVSLSVLKTKCLSKMFFIALDMLKDDF